MLPVTQNFRDFAAEEDGQALIEYALILALVTLVALGGLRLLSTNLGSLLDAIASAVAGAT